MGLVVEVVGTGVRGEAAGGAPHDTHERRRPTIASGPGRATIDFT
jgi:hypothetical protein